MKTKTIGDYGERIAARYLSRHGYRIIERNYKKAGIFEIDIIAYDGDCLCFIEVKTRTRDDYGLACEAVNYSKQRKIIKGASVYLALNNIDCPTRFDVVEVYVKDMNFFSKKKINIIKNAFYA